MKITKRYFFLLILAFALFVSDTVFLTSTVLSASLSQTLPQPLVPYASIQIDIKHENVTLNMRRVDFWDGYVVFVGTATAVDGSGCISRRDVALQLGDIQYEPANREKTRQGYGIDAPGTGFLIQCLSRNEPQIVFLPFVAPVNQGEAAIIYKNQVFKLSSSLEKLQQTSEEAQPTATFTPTPTYTPTPTPTPTFTPAPVTILDGASPNFSLPLPSNASSIFGTGTVSNQGVEFTLERIDFWDILPDDTRPRNDKFIVFIGTLLPNGDTSSHCAGAGEVELLIGQQTYQMDNMRSANQFYESDFPGYIVPQCVVGNTPVTTLFVFDVALTSDKAFLSFNKALLELDLSIDSASEASIAQAITPTNAISSTLSVNTPTAISTGTATTPPTEISITTAPTKISTEILTKASTATATTAPTKAPTQTATTAPTKASTQTATTVPTKAPTETPTAVVIPSGVVNSNANLRAGPGTDFDIVGSVKANQLIEIIGTNSAQDWFQLPDETWIAAFLVTDVTAPIPTIEPPTPTKISVPSSTSTPTQVAAFQVSDLLTLILAPVEKVEAVLGEPQLITPFDAGDFVNYQGAGESRDYAWGDYLIWGFYDNSGILRGIQIWDGITEQGYTIDEWPEVLAKFGLPRNISPDVLALAGVRWDNLNGFKVEIYADGLKEKGGVIWTIQIFAQE